VLSRALEIVVAPALERGDALAATRLLDPWREVLADRPAWAACRARAAALLGADTEACALLAHALEAAPDDVGCLAELARAARRRGDSDGARRAWEAIARLDPQAALPHAELGTLALCAGRPSEALAHWTEALARDPDHPCARAARACLEDDPPAALRWWRALAERHPRASTAWYGLGLAATSAGDWESARAHLERALALDPAAGAILEALGRAIARHDAASARAIIDGARTPAPPPKVAGTPSAAV
jgi:tetratricopeptide (TPR) repeat protein